MGSVRICTPTPSCPEVRPCSQVLLIVSEGNLLPRPTHHEDQDHRTTREEILRLDRRIYLGFALHLPTDVDQQTRIRRIWPIHRSPKMLLDGFLCIVCNKLLKLRRVL